MQQQLMNSAQAAAELGVSKATLLRWFREGRISPVNRDWRGWRIFTPQDLMRIKLELGDVASVPPTADDQKRRKRLCNYLRRVPTFRALPHEILDELARCARFQGLLTGQTLFAPGNRSTGLHILVKGRIKLFRTSPEGREQVLAVVTPFQTLGEAVLFRQEERHFSYAISLESSTVMTLALSRVRQLTQQHSQLAFAFLRAFAQRIENLEERLEQLALLSVEQRLARMLLDQLPPHTSNQQPAHIQLSLSVSDTASILGVARESLSRSLVRLERDGLIKRSGKTITILDREGLERL